MVSYHGTVDKRFEPLSVSGEVGLRGPVCCHQLSLAISGLLGSSGRAPALACSTSDFEDADQPRFLCKLKVLLGLS